MKIGNRISSLVSLGKKLGLWCLNSFLLPFASGVKLLSQVPVLVSSFIPWLDQTLGEGLLRGFLALLGLGKCISLPGLQRKTHSLDGFNHRHIFWQFLRLAIQENLISCEGSLSGLLIDSHLPDMSSDDLYSVHVRRDREREREKGGRGNSFCVFSHKTPLLRPHLTLLS